MFLICVSAFSEASSTSAILAVGVLIDNEVTLVTGLKVLISAARRKFWDALNFMEMNNNCELKIYICIGPRVINTVN